MIATKVGPAESGLARPDELRGLVEENLRELQLDTLDLVYLRQHGLESIAEHFGALAELRDEGMIRHLGRVQRPGRSTLRRLSRSRRWSPSRTATASTSAG